VARRYPCGIRGDGHCRYDVLQHCPGAWLETRQLDSQSSLLCSCWQRMSCITCCCCTWQQERTDATISRQCYRAMQAQAAAAAANKSSSSSGRSCHLHGTNSCMLLVDCRPAATSRECLCCGMSSTPPGAQQRSARQATAKQQHVHHSFAANVARGVHTQTAPRSDAGVASCHHVLTTASWETKHKLHSKRPCLAAKIMVDSLVDLGRR